MTATASETSAAAGALAAPVATDVTFKILRFNPEVDEGALAVAHARQMDFTGRPMKGYVYVDPPGLTQDQDLKAWVHWCAGYVADLPAKKVKKRKSA